MIIEKRDKLSSLKNESNQDNPNFCDTPEKENKEFEVAEDKDDSILLYEYDTFFSVFNIFFCRYYTDVFFVVDSVITFCVPNI